MHILCHFAPDKMSSTTAFETTSVYAVYTINIVSSMAYGSLNCGNSLHF